MPARVMKDRVRVRRRSPTGIVPWRWCDSKVPYGRSIALLLVIITLELFDIVPFDGRHSSCDSNIYCFVLANCNLPSVQAEQCGSERLSVSRPKHRHVCTPVHQL